MPSQQFDLCVRQIDLRTKIHAQVKTSQSAQVQVNLASSKVNPRLLKGQRAGLWIRLSPVGMWRFVHQETGKMPSLPANGQCSVISPAHCDRTPDNPLRGMIPNLVLANFLSGLSSVGVPKICPDLCSDPKILAIFCPDSRSSLEYFFWKTVKKYIKNLHFRPRDIHSEGFH